MDQKHIQVFEDAAEEYDAWFDLHRFAYESELQALKRFVPRGGNGLEIGVGSGRFASPLGVRLGVEPARAMALKARGRGLTVLQSYAEELPLKDQAFDFVLLVTVLCFLRDPLQALFEATRVLRAKGRLIIGMIDPASPLGRIYEAKKQESKFYSNARFYKVRQVLDWLRSLGYENFESCQTIFKSISQIKDPEPVKEGHGEGGFVVISARKRS